MPEKKRQHYVPQFYLRNFSNHHGRSICVFSLDSERIIAVGSLKGKAQKDYFYGRDGAVEDTLGKVEGAASEIISQIVGHDVYPRILSRDYLDLLVFIVFLCVRTQYAANEENEIRECQVSYLTYVDVR